MYKQSRLAFVEEHDTQLEQLWEKLPEQARHEVTQQYARLMARATVRRIGELRDQQEAGNEPVKR